MTFRKMKVTRLEIPLGAHSTNRGRHVYLCERSDEEGLFIHDRDDSYSWTEPYELANTSVRSAYIDYESTVVLDDGSEYMIPKYYQANIRDHMRTFHQSQHWSMDSFPEARDDSMITAVYRQWLVRP